MEITKMLKYLLISLLSISLLNGVIQSQQINLNDVKTILKNKNQGYNPLLSYSLELAYTQFQNINSPNRSNDRSGRALLSIPGANIFEQLILIDFFAKENPELLFYQLIQLGLQYGTQDGNVISGYFPVSRLPYISGIPSLNFADISMRKNNSGLVTSQGDISMYSDISREYFNLDGDGINVGIISDSFDGTGKNLAKGIASGDLPKNTEILLDVSGASDEGRAMAEIVHDIAPGAGIKFHTGWTGMAGMSQGIRNLANANCQIIVDDILYIAEPFFADGIIAQAVTDVVLNNNVTYFAAAGNFGRKAIVSEFRPSSKRGLNNALVHDFDPRSKDKPRLNFILGSGTAYFILQWQDPYASLNSPGSPPNGAKTDYDLILYDGHDSSVYSGWASIENNIGKDPIEILVFNNPGGMAKRMSLGIELQSGQNPPPPFHLIWIGPLLWEYEMILNVPDHVNGPTIYGHANSYNAIACGAVYYIYTPPFLPNNGVEEIWLQSYSSAGGIPILFLPDGSPTYDLRLKPNICAPDGANTTFFGQDQDGDGWPNFFGTSAAAPHAAGVAALALSKAKNYPPHLLKDMLQRTATDMNQPGFDWGTGFGFINAYNALSKILSDVNHDGCVDMLDLWLTFRATQSLIHNPRFDIDGDGKITAIDLNTIISQFDNYGSPCYLKK
jgi:subtilisin family serine protease